MSGYFTESNYENAVLQLLNEDLGYTYVYDRTWSAITTLRFMRMSCCPLCSESTKTCQWML